jgi:hypothetical protein
MEYTGKAFVDAGASRPRIAVHLGVELIPPALLEGLLGRDGTIEAFDEHKQYVIRSFVPPKRTALATLIERAQLLIGVNWLQERAKAGFSADGLVRSFTRLDSATPWLKIVNLPERLFKRLQFPLHEPVYMRVHPPRPSETRMFECLAEFNNGAVVQLSELADSPGPDVNNARLILAPLDAWDRQYLDGLDAASELSALFANEGIQLAPEAPRAPVRLITPVRRHQEALPAPRLDAAE